jgi:hypothetical protein
VDKKENRGRKKIHKKGNEDKDKETPQKNGRNKRRRDRAIPHHN